jgi:hypothetical protein
MRVYTAIRGWDLATKQVKAWGFGANGSIHRAVWKPTDSGWSVVSAIADSEGAIVKKRAIVDMGGEGPVFTIFEEQTDTVDPHDGTSKVEQKVVFKRR